MTKIFSTKLDVKTLELFDSFCDRYHLKKSSVLEEFIQEGIRRYSTTWELVKSIERGLEDQKAGNLYPTDEVEKMVFGKRKAA